MKIFKKIIAVCVVSTLGITSVSAQSKKIITQEIPVEGVCKMCKKRIENAALVKGVKMAKWDNTTGLLTVVYSSNKTSDSTICTSIAKAGHDNKLIKAKENEYGQLPGCCAYRDGIQKH